MDIEIPDTIFVHWKTTVNGLLSAGVAVILALMTLPPTASRCVIALAALRAVIGCLQKDEGSAPDDPASRPAA